MLRYHSGMAVRCAEVKKWRLGDEEERTVDVDDVPYAPNDDGLHLPLPRELGIVNSVALVYVSDRRKSLRRLV
ncbi:hypothetical protein NMY22_g11968 [Coprinellus aureogranulatus]|nr:hypothetical protein NMY22_g11968 [Coprinellus aureogranulatus]